MSLLPSSFFSPFSVNRYYLSFLLGFTWALHRGQKEENIPSTEVILLVSIKSSNLKEKKTKNLYCRKSNQYLSYVLLGKTTFLILSQLLIKKKLILNQPLTAVTGTSEIFTICFKNLDVFLCFALWWYNYKKVTYYVSCSVKKRSRSIYYFSVPWCSK